MDGTWVRQEEFDELATRLEKICQGIEARKTWAEAYSRETLRCQSAGRYIQRPDKERLKIDTAQINLTRTYQR